MTRIARQRFVSRIAIAALLFAQALVAFADCRMPARSPAAAIAVENPPCHESSGETNLCVAHCLAGDQSLDKPQSSVPAPAAAPVLVLQLASDMQYASAPAVWRFVPPAAAPPPRILFRTLRI
jgi:hypothetical protein